MYILRLLVSACLDMGSWCLKTFVNQFVFLLSLRVSRGFYGFGRISKVGDVHVHVHL